MKRRLLRLLVNAASIAALLVVLGALTAVVVVPRLVGGTSLTVLSGSMSPSIPKGSLVVIKPVDPATLVVGDVITWQVRPGEATYITHRIVAVNDTTPLTFVTKGDANGAPDLTPVPAGAVRGRVIFDVPRLGTMADTANSRTGAMVLVGFGVAAIVTGLGRGLLAARRERARRPEESVDGALILVCSTADGDHRRALIDLVSLLGGRVIEIDDSHVRAAVVVDRAARLAALGDLLHASHATELRSTSLHPADARRSSPAQATQDEDWVLVAVSLGSNAADRRALVETIAYAESVVTALSERCTALLVGGPSSVVERLTAAWTELGVAPSARSDELAWPDSAPASTCRDDMPHMTPTFALTSTTDAAAGHVP